MSVKVQEIKSGQDQVYQLLDDCFPVEKGQHFIDDFPVWNDSLGADMVRLGAYNDTELIAAAFMRFAKMKTPGNALTVGLIGAVVTKESWRGKGLASALVQGLLVKARDRGTVAVFLWGSEHQMYNRLGFELCGMQMRLPLKDLGLSKNPVKYAQGWHPSIFSSLKSRKGGLELSAEDIKWMEAHRNVKWYWKGRPESPSAYIGYGRGIDLQGIVHEWGGKAEDLRDLLSVVWSENDEAQLLGSPANLDACGFPYEKGITEYLCLAKILDPESIVHTYASGLNFKAQKEKQTQSWQINIGEKEFEVSERQLVKLLFGPETFEDAGKNFPLPLWIWGLDSA